MVKRKKVKKRVSRKIVKKKECCEKCWGVGFMKLSAIAFILFLITVWPGLNNLINNIHWSWFLIAVIVFGIIGWRKCCKKK